FRLRFVLVESHFGVVVELNLVHFPRLVFVAIADVVIQQIYIAGGGHQRSTGYAEYDQVLGHGLAALAKAIHQRSILSSSTWVRPWALSRPTVISARPLR